MIPVPEQPANMSKGIVQEISDQVHGDLARDRQVLGPPFRTESLFADVPALRNQFADVFGCQHGSAVSRGADETPLKRLARQIY